MFQIVFADEKIHLVSVYHPMSSMSFGNSTVVRQFNRINTCENGTVLIRISKKRSLLFFAGEEEQSPAVDDAKARVPFFPRLLL